MPVPIDLYSAPTDPLTPVPYVQPFHEAPTRRVTAITRALSLEEEGIQTLISPRLFVTQHPHRANCGHDTVTPRWSNGRSSCAACWARSHCRTDFCGQSPAWGDKCGFWWCEHHEAGAVLMTLGSDLGYTRLTLPEGIHVESGRINWLYFAKSATYSRRDLVGHAILIATRARLTHATREEVML